MRRADRLFQIVQYLRSRKITTAQWLAEKLEVSKRTVYRDIEDLISSGVPIEGEAGVGYALRKKLDLPPLVFDRLELTAIELGLKFVQVYTDDVLAKAAGIAMAKVRNALADTAAEHIRSPETYVPKREKSFSPQLSRVLEAIDAKQKIQLHYTDVANNVTQRTIWPLGIFFWGNAWTLTAWCELREDFRSFRFDRMTSMTVTGTRYESVKGKRLRDYFLWIEQQYSVPIQDFDVDAI